MNKIMTKFKMASCYPLKFRFMLYFLTDTPVIKNDGATILHKLLDHKVVFSLLLPNFVLF